MVRWLGFCACNALTRSVVHFFPSSGNVTAPYPSNCKITLFGKGLDRKTILLEGARLSQPDGVKLEEAFPALKGGDVNGLFGVIVEMSTNQPRIDVSPSACIVELTTRAHSVRYWPKPLQNGLSTKTGTKEISRGMVVQDALNQSSLVIVNPETHTLSARCSLLVGEKEGVVVDKESGPQEGMHTFDLKSHEVAGENAIEIPLDDILMQEMRPQECSFGLSRLASIAVEVAPSAEQGQGSATSGLHSHSGVYIMYRDTATKRPLSVIAI